MVLLGDGGGDDGDEEVGDETLLGGFCEIEERSVDLYDELERSKDRIFFRVEDELLALA